MSSQETNKKKVISKFYAMAGLKKIFYNIRTTSHKKKPLTREKQDRFLSTIKILHYIILLKITLIYLSKITLL